MHLHLTGRSSSERTEFCAGTGKRYAKVRVNVNGQPESSILVGPHMRGVLGKLAAYRAGPCLHVQRLLKSPAVKKGPARNISIFFDGLSGSHFAPPTAIWQHQAVEGDIHCRHSGTEVAARCILNCAVGNHNDMPAAFKAYLTILDKLQGPTCSGQLLIRVSLTSIADVKLALVTSEHACMACRRVL